MSKLPAYVVIVAVLVIIGFGWLCFELMGAATSLPKDEQFRWDHMVVVFDSVQTMAAAALGVLLGTTVQQARVDKAKSETNAAQARADANAEDAAKAREARKIVTGLQAPGGAPAKSDETLRAVTLALS
jgi:hypothetical protein